MNIFKFTVSGLIVISAWACAGKGNVATAPDESIVRARLAEAESLYRRGCYVTLKRAFEIHKELYAIPSLRERTALPFLKTCLILATRENDIHIPAGGSVLMDTAETIFRENRGLERYRTWMEIALGLFRYFHGIRSDNNSGLIDRVGSSDTFQALSEATQKLLASRNALEIEASADEFLAFLYAGWNCDTFLLQENRRDPADFAARFPESTLLKYLAAVCGPVADRKALEEIVAAEPECYEALFHLGELSIGAGRVLSAEKELLRAHEGIPESPRILILLAGVYFATEEYETGLDTFDRALIVSPEDRDALLGKAVCLASLHRYEESIVVLDRIVALGFWLLGESHYWLAWNKHELGRNADALTEINQAKGRLPTNSEAFSLSGTVAFEMGEMERAEKDFNESLKYNPSNTEALFGLGGLKAKTGHWAESAGYFEKAARILDETLAGVRAKIEEIRASDLSAERKSRLIQRNERKLESQLYSRATAYYGAAGGRYNAGDPAGAEALASLAADHPSYTSKVAELLLRIRGRTKTSY
jgi:tetratricopeptide (TPR) repeat protein